ncbi:MAG TPA: SIS domain-containing protein [Candidatus Cryosericum sp.]|nr:SIS domain-containing protein [Candidatus Cryosericum sp.]
MQQSIMWQYIAQEPVSLAHLMQSEQTDEYAEKNGERIRTVYIVGHGSSFNAGVCTVGFFAESAKIRAYAQTPGFFCNGGSTFSLENPQSTLIVLISQTGTSAGTIGALEHAKASGFRTLAITEVEDSPIARKADDVLRLFCGIEESNAKTKGYSATLALLMRLALSLGKRNGILNEQEHQICLNELDGMIRELPNVQERVQAFCRRTAFGQGMRELYVLGSGMNFGTAQEGQLKLMETMCISTMFNDIGEFSHGMHRAIHRDSSVLLIKACDSMKDSIEQSYQYLKGICDNVWIIDASGEESPDDSRIVLPVFKQTQSLLLTTLAVQILSVFAPECNGLDPNRDAHNDFTIVAATRV